MFKLQQIATNYKFAIILVQQKQGKLFNVASQDEVMQEFVFMF